MGRRELPDFTSERKGRGKEEELSQRGGTTQKGEPMRRRSEVLNPEEVMQQGAQLAKMSTDAGRPMSDEEGYSIVNSLNEDKKVANAQQMQLETHFGDVGSHVLSSYYPDASEEINTLVRKKAEEAGESGQSEADIRKNLVQEVVKLKNQIANVKKSIKPTTLFSKLGRKLTGSGRSAEKEEEHLRKEIKPLLDQGLYDESRAILSEGGLYPEQRERVVSGLAEPTKKAMTQFPNMKKEVPGKMGKKKAGLGGWGSVVQHGIEEKLEEAAPYSPKQMETINSAVKDIFTNEPKANLILLRKEFEDRGVDWQAYKDAVDQGVLEGYIKLEDEDQYNMYSDIQEGPLDDLDKMMYKLNLIGR